MFSGTETQHRACISKCRWKSQRGSFMELAEPWQEKRTRNGATRDRPLTFCAARPPWFLCGRAPCRDGQVMRQCQIRGGASRYSPLLMGWTSVTRMYIKPHTGLSMRINFSSGITCTAVSKAVSLGTISPLLFKLRNI